MPAIPHSFRLRECGLAIRRRFFGEESSANRVCRPTWKSLCAGNRRLSSQDRGDAAPREDQRGTAETPSRIPAGLRSMAPDEPRESRLDSLIDSAWHRIIPPPPGCVRLSRGTAGLWLAAPQQGPIYQPDKSMSIFRGRFLAIFTATVSGTLTYPHDCVYSGHHG